MPTLERLKEVELFAWIGEDGMGSGVIGIKQGIVPAGYIPLVATAEFRRPAPSLGFGLANSHGMAWKLAGLNELIPYDAVFISDAPITQDEVDHVRELATEYGWNL